MSETVVIDFRVVVESTSSSAGHKRFRCEGIINTGLEAHLKGCKECGEMISKDLRDFADQIAGIWQREQAPK